MSGNVSIEAAAAVGREHAIGAADEFDYPNLERGDAPDMVARAEWLLTLFAVIYPDGKLTGKRRQVAAYRRFCVLVFDLRPELTQCASIEELAEELGCSKWAIYKIRDQVRAKVFDQ